MNEVTNTMKETQNAYDAYVNEIKECVSGIRGWVDCSIVRSKKIGIAHSNLIGVATALGLNVTKHGKYGYTANRK